MDLPVTSGDPFEGETLDGLAGIPARFGSCRGGWNGSYDPPLSEFTENRHRVSEWCRPQLRSFCSTLREATALRAVDPRSRSFVFCPYETLVSQFRSFGLTLQEASAVWAVLLCVRSFGLIQREASLTPRVWSFGLTSREASVVRLLVPQCRSYGLILREASARWALIPHVRSFGLTLREASAVRLLVPLCQSFGLTVREASALWALIPHDRSFGLTPREASAVRTLFPRCRSFGLTVREGQKVMHHLRRALSQHCWFRVGEFSLFSLGRFFIKAGKVGLNLDERSRRRALGKRVLEKKQKTRSVKYRKHTPQERYFIYIYIYYIDGKP